MGDEARGTLVDRRRSIVSGAVEVFSEFGYHRARMTQIAGVSGITGPALYRHFPGKEALLEAAVEVGTCLAEGVFEASGADHGDPQDQLRRTIDALSRTAVENQSVGAVIQRDMRHLTRPVRARFECRWTAMLTEFARRISAVRPECTGADAELLARAMLAVAASPSTFRVRGLTAARRRRILTRMFDAVGDAELRRVTTRVNRPPALPDTRVLVDRVGRREAIISVANRLFRRRGFHGVSIEDIADAAGVTGPTVYSYFDSKADLLATGYRRGAGWLELALEQGLATGGTAAGRLEALVRALIDFGLRHGDTMALLIHEWQNLPADQIRDCTRVRYDYTAEMARLVRIERPGVDEPAARALVRGSITVVMDLCVPRRHLGRPELAAEIERMVLRILYVSAT